MFIFLILNYMIAGDFIQFQFSDIIFKQNFPVHKKRGRLFRQPPHT